MPVTGSLREGLPAGRVRRFGLLALAVFFVLAGANHFVDTEFYLAMMPGYMPAHRLMVLVSGILEICGGVAVLSFRFRSVAGWGLVLLLLAVFPANIHMAVNATDFPDLPVWTLVARLPIQFLLIAWAVWATRPEKEVP